MAIDQYEAGQEVDVLVCTKRGKEGEWIPATVFLVDEGVVDVRFDSGARQKFYVPFETRIKPRGESSTIVFKV
jgi:hypothetical protein